MGVHPTMRGGLRHRVTLQGKKHERKEIANLRSHAILKIYQRIPGRVFFTLLEKVEFTFTSTALYLYYAKWLLRN